MARVVSSFQEIYLRTRNDFLGQGFLELSCLRAYLLTYIRTDSCKNMHRTNTIVVKNHAANSHDNKNSAGRPGDSVAQWLASRLAARQVVSSMLPSAPDAHCGVTS